MRIEQFQEYLNNLSKQFQDFDEIAPIVVGKVAIEYSKNNYAKEQWDGKGWMQVARREQGTKAYEYNKKRHSARLMRQILAGDSGDLYVPNKTTPIFIKNFYNWL